VSCQGIRSHYSPYTPECHCEYCPPAANQSLVSNPFNSWARCNASMVQAAFQLMDKCCITTCGNLQLFNYTVLPEIAVAKIREDAPFDKVCHIGCGVTTGVGIINTARGTRANVVVSFGLGGIGLKCDPGGSNEQHDCGVGILIPTSDRLLRIWHDSLLSTQ